MEHDLRRTEVAVDVEGFFDRPRPVDARRWPRRSHAAWIAELTDRHWQVIKFMRNEYAEKGTAPTVRALGKTSGIPIKELYELFPKGPAKLAAKIAGIPKPRGCI